MASVKKVYRQSFSLLSIPSLQIKTAEDGRNPSAEYSVLGGHLYVDGQPVQHYYSKDMFYYEKDGEQVSIFLRHHGLMADIVRLKDGIRTTQKAGSELHYTMTYQSASSNTLDIAFGMGIDESRKSYYYCGLIFNGIEIISLPTDEKACKNQGIMSISYDEVTGNLISKWNTRGYVGAKDKSGAVICPEFLISSMKMAFDALYNSCNVTITEGKTDIQTYIPSNSAMNLITTEDKKAQGSCSLSYTDYTEAEKTLEIFGIDSIENKDQEGKPFTSYYCGFRYNGREVLPLPADDMAKKAQNFIQLSLMGDSWLLGFKDDCYSAFYDEIKKNEPLFFIKNVLITNTFANVIEDKSVTSDYKAKGYLKVKEELANRRKWFRRDSIRTEQLKQSCLASELNTPPLTLELLCSIEPPTVSMEIEENGQKKIITMDGQQYCGYLTSSVLSDLVNYYTGDTANEDKSITFSDVFGKNRAGCLASINSISNKLIQEIENAEDTENNKKKGYLVNFIKTLSPIILTNALAEKKDNAIKDGYGSQEEEDQALRKSRFYLSYTPTPDEEQELSVLSTTPEYHEVTAIIDKYVYLSVTDKLKLFMEDKTTGYDGQKEQQSAQQYWAEQMYYHYVETLNMLHMSYETNPAKVTHIIKLLGILDSGSYDIRDSIDGHVIEDTNKNVFHTSYALALYGQLSNYSITQLVSLFKGESDFENYCKLLTELFGAFYDKVKNGKILLPSDLQEALDQFLKQNKTMFVQWAIFQSVSMMQFMISSGDMMSALLTYNPLNPGMAKFFSCVNVLMGMVSFANIFMQWKDLSEVQKAESILAVLTSAFSVGRNFMLWKAVNTIFDINATPNERINAYYRYQVGGGKLDSLESVSFHEGDTFNLRESIEDSSKRYSLHLSENPDNPVAFVKNAASKVFLFVELAFNILNIALMGIAFVAAVLDLAEMFKHKHSYKDLVLIFSGINAGLCALSFVLTVAQPLLGLTSFALAATIASAIPCINGIIMLAMLICSLVLLIRHDDPVAPITLLIKEKIKAPVNALPKPTQKWIDDNTPKSGLRFQSAMA